MAEGSFSSFSLLPGEIRDQIWDFSTRPIGVRGVQYFSVLESCDNTSPILEVFKRHIVKRTRKDQNQVLAAPLVGKETSCPSWYEGNRSTYAIDSGLWTACKESRAAMYRHYRPEEWVDLRKKQRKYYDKHQTYFHYSLHSGSKHEQMPATFNAESSGGTQSLTILPGYDLLHLAPVKTGLSWYALGKDMPFSSPEFGFGGIRHTAIDFDPSWSLEELERYQLKWEELRLKEAQMDYLRWEMPHETCPISRLRRYGSWTIVFGARLRRKSTVLDEHMTEMLYGRYGSWQKEQLVFHAAGCRYYAMPEHRASELCGYDAEDEPEGDNDPFSFVYELEELDARQEAFERRGEDEGSGVDEDYYVASVRLLVCERD
ncbi:Methyltransferase domain-containing protein [Colletotrichum asianum]